MTRILTILRTPGAMLAALVLALVAQLEHTAQVFSMVVGASGIYAQLHAYAFAVAVETAVLLFVLAGHKRISYGFAIATALTNLSYYSMMGVPLLSLQAAPAWLMSLLLPAAIVGYSHIIAENRSSVDVPLDDLQTPVATPSATTGHVSTEHTDHANQDTTPVQPVATGAGDTPVPATKPRERTVRKSAQRGKPSAAQRRAQIASAGLDSATAVVAQFGVSLRTAQLDLEQIRKATTQTNGVHA